VHGDFKAKNILIGESGLRLIDTDGARFLVNRRQFTKHFQSDFKRFLKNWPDGNRVRERLKNRLSAIFDQ
jgi:thiamine kinase-like enzyme